MKIKMAQMAILATILVILAVMGDFYRAAVGIGIGLPVSIFNYWLVASAVPDRPGLTPRQMKGFFLRRAMLRLGIAMAVLIVAALGGAEFLIGVAVGLTLQMSSTVFDMFKLRR